MRIRAPTQGESYLVLDRPALRTEVGAVARPMSKRPLLALGLELGETLSCGLLVAVDACQLHGAVDQLRIVGALAADLGQALTNARIVELLRAEILGTK